MRKHLLLVALSGLLPASGMAAPPQDQSFKAVVPEAASPLSALADRLARASIQQAGGAGVVTLTWAPHAVYTIPIRQGMFTTFQFPSGEPIREFAVSSPDSVQLHVDSASGVAMLKLTAPVASVATVITTKHLYYLRIVPSQDDWYQGVSWSLPSGDLAAGDFSGGIYKAPGSAQQSDSAQSVIGDLKSQAPLFNGDPNFSYRVVKVVGDAPFAPAAVWDNGRFTWIQFRPGLRELPAVFSDGPNGLEIVNYTVHANGTQLLVNRLMDRFVLKLGKEEVVMAAGSGPEAR